MLHIFFVYLVMVSVYMSTAVSSEHKDTGVYEITVRFTPFYSSIVPDNLSPHDENFASHIIEDPVCRELLHKTHTRILELKPMVDARIAAYKRCELLKKELAWTLRK